jgi:hypothetical protein
MFLLLCFTCRGCDLHWCAAAEERAQQQAQLESAASAERLHHQALRGAAVITDVETVATAARFGCAVIAAAPLQHLAYEGSFLADFNATAAEAMYERGDASIAAYHAQYAHWELTDAAVQRAASYPVVTVADLQARCAQQQQQQQL